MQKTGQANILNLRLIYLIKSCFYLTNSIKATLPNKHKEPVFELSGITLFHRELLFHKSTSISLLSFSLRYKKFRKSHQSHFRITIFLFLLLGISVSALFFKDPNRRQCPFRKRVYQRPHVYNYV